MRETTRRRRGALAAAGLCAMWLAGCSVDGTAVRSDGEAAPPVASSAPATSAAPSSGDKSTQKSPAKSAEKAPEESAGESTSTGDPSKESGDSGDGSVAGEAMSMTCDRYKRLTPDQQKEVTAALGKRLKKKQLVDNPRSWAIVNSFCRNGLVRNSPGVKDSE